jgi:hypothetical protein
MRYRPPSKPWEDYLKKKKQTQETQQTGQGFMGRKIPPHPVKPQRDRGMILNIMKMMASGQQKKNRKE